MNDMEQSIQAALQARLREIEELTKEREAAEDELELAQVDVDLARARYQLELLLEGYEGERH